MPFCTNKTTQSRNQR